jgi:lipoprotein signal peptidase
MNSMSRSFWADATYLTSLFNIVRAHNTGAAFWFLTDASGWQRWFFTGINVADSAITIGAACLIVDELLRVRRGR